jgi:DnaD/phage-associated family protein
MKPFAGFPGRMAYTQVPSPFIGQVMAEISDIDELKVTLYIMAEVYRKKGSPRFVTFGELLASSGLAKSLGQTGSTEEVLRNALKLAIERKTILCLTVDSYGETTDIYFLNTEADRRAITKIESGELDVPGIDGKVKTAYPTEPSSDIFTLYEENIGMLTPMIGEELKAAEKLYPESWLWDAIREAVKQNKRKWSYISAILEHWSSEGRSNGTHRRDSKKKDADKYVSGRYGHMVKR